MALQPTRSHSHTDLCRPVQVSCWTVYMPVWENCKANNLTQNDSAVVLISHSVQCVDPPPPLCVRTNLAANSAAWYNCSGPHNSLSNKCSHWLIHSKAANDTAPSL